MLPLAPGAADVWVTLVASCTPADGGFWSSDVLSEEERNRNAAFHSEPARVRDLATRIFVRQVLSRYLGTPAHALKFARTRFGRPFLVQEASEAQGLSFNISHSLEIIVLAVTRGRNIGVDVEDVRRSGRVLSRYLSGSESDGIAALPPAERWTRFLELWTLKESYVKATGLGLHLPLHEVEFLYLNERSIAPRFGESISSSLDCWNFQLWNPCPWTVASLCTEGAPHSAPVVCSRRIEPDNTVINAPFAVTRSTLS